MKFSRSRDGLLRATVRIEHRVGKDALIAGVMHASITYGDEPRSRARVEAAVRRMLSDDGSDWGMIAHDRADEHPDELDAAVDLVERLFPELDAPQ